MEQKIETRSFQFHHRKKSLIISCSVVQISRIFVLLIIYHVFQMIRQSCRCIWVSIRLQQRRQMEYRSLYLPAKFTDCGVGTIARCCSHFFAGKIVLFLLFFSELIIFFFFWMSSFRPNGSTKLPARFSYASDARPCWSVQRKQPRIPVSNKKNALFSKQETSCLLNYNFSSF